MNFANLQNCETRVNFMILQRSKRNTGHKWSPSFVSKGKFHAKRRAKSLHPPVRKKSTELNWIFDLRGLFKFFNTLTKFLNNEVTSQYLKKIVESGSEFVEHQKICSVICNFSNRLILEIMKSFYGLIWLHIETIKPKPSAINCFWSTMASRNYRACQSC